MIKIDDTVREQAEELERLLPRLMRSLFPLDQEYPVNDLPLAQRRVCSILQAGPRSVSCLSEELKISGSAITQMADRLERSGMVERITGEDRRIKKLRLSETGVEVMRTRQERRILSVAQTLSQLSPATRDLAIRTIQQLICAANEATPED